MKRTLFGSMFFVLLASLAAFAGDQHDHVTGHDMTKAMQHSEGPAMKLTDGVVKKVDQKGGTITLKHGEITSIKMPAMTMDYQVKQLNQLKSIHAGDKVRFTVEKLHDDYIVTHIELAK